MAEDGYLQYYDLESYLLERVGPRFREIVELTPFGGHLISLDGIPDDPSCVP
jgi:hypothetical protein